MSQIVDACYGVGCVDEIRTKKHIESANPQARPCYIYKRAVHSTCKESTSKVDYYLRLYNV